MIEFIKNMAKKVLVPKKEEIIEEGVETVEVVDDMSKKHTGYNPAFIYE